MDILMLLFFVLILIFGGIVLAFVIGKGRSETGLNKEKYHVAWLGIEQRLSADNEASIHVSVLNADKLLDKALRERGFQGKTMGERMKSAKENWSNANQVWGAHKLRNQIAHETNASVSYHEARRALAGFKQGLKDLGAI